MSQVVVPAADAGDIGTPDWSPTPNWQEIDSNDLLSSIDVSVSAGGTGRFACSFTSFYPPQEGTYQLKIWFDGGLTSGTGGWSYDVTLRGTDGNHSFTYNVAAPVAPPPGGFIDTHTLTTAEKRQLILMLTNNLAAEVPNGADVIVDVTLAGGDGTYHGVVYYIELSMPDPFTYSASPSQGAKAGGDSVTFSLRGAGIVAADPANLRLQFASDYNEVTPTVVDDDTITVVTPSNSINTPNPLTGAWLPLLFLYDNTNPNDNISINTIPSAFTDNIWTYSDATGIQIDPADANATLAISGDASFEQDETGSGGVVIGGATQFQLLAASTPSVQRGGQWRLNSFFFRYRAEEEA